MNTQVCPACSKECTPYALSLWYCGACKIVYDAAMNVHEKQTQAMKEFKVCRK